MAWWVPSWEGWGERTAEENRALREQLLARGEYDGYLLYDGGDPIAWCQVGRRDRLEKLVRQFGLEPDRDAWAITCFEVARERRRQGVASLLLRRVLEDLRARRVTRVQAFPRRGSELAAGELWTGPESMFRRAGFAVVRDDPDRPVLELATG